MNDIVAASRNEGLLIFTNFNRTPRRAAVHHHGRGGPRRDGTPGPRLECGRPLLQRRVTDDDLRIVAAGLMRELGHEFVARDLSDDQLAALIAALRIELADAREAAPAHACVLTR